MSNSDPTLFERLAKVEPAKLARLLFELAAQDQTILEQVQFLLASGDTTAIAKAVRSTLRAWKRSPRFIHYQEAFAFGEQLDRLLDSVEDGFLAQIPRWPLTSWKSFCKAIAGSWSAWTIRPAASARPTGALANCSPAPRRGWLRPPPWQNGSPSLWKRTTTGCATACWSTSPKFWTVKRLPGWWIAGESKRLKGRVRGVTARPC